jgi:hypothetical protein
MSMLLVFDYIASNVTTTNDELESVYKEMVVA